MASYDFESSGPGALGGAMGGAGIGTMILPGWGTAIGAGVGTLAGFFASPKRKKEGANIDIDISKELDKIGDLFNTQRAAVTRGVEEDLARKKFSLASSLAGRGIYSSPVSQYSYGELDRGAQSALAQALAGIGGQEAQTRSSLLSQLMGQSFSTKQAEEERRRMARNQLLSSLMGAGTSMLLSNRGGGGGAGGTPTGYGGLPGDKPGGFDYYRPPDTSGGLYPNAHKVGW